MMKYLKLKGETLIPDLIRNKKEKLKQNLRVRKKIVLTGDSMANSISEKGLSVNHKVKIVNFSDEKILEKLDDKIKENLDNLIVHVVTNDFTKNVNLLTNIK